MSKHTQTTLIWLLILLLVGVFLHAVNEILLPFILAFIFSYLLNPLVNRLQGRHISRGLATFLVIGFFFLLIGSLIAFLVPMLYDQLVHLIEQIPSYIATLQKEVIPSLTAKLKNIAPPATLEKAANQLGNTSTTVFSFLLTVLDNIWKSGVGFINVISLIFVTPIVTFYLLYDWHRLLAKIDSLLPRRHIGMLHSFFQQVDHVLSGYLRGQMTVCFILATFYGITLSLAGLDLGLFIGIMTGILAFIPYVGTAIGFSSAILLAFLQFGDFSDVLIIGGIFVLGQVIEGNFITPKLIGKKVGLHPVWIIFGLFVGGTLLGFTGVLLALPVTAIIGVASRFAVAQYLASDLYDIRPSNRSS